MRIGVHAGEGMLWRGRSQRSGARPMRDKAKPPGLTTPSATNANATLKVSYPLHSVSGISSNRANQKAPQAIFDIPNSLCFRPRLLARGVMVLINIKLDGKCLKGK